MPAVGRSRPSTGRTQEVGALLRRIATAALVIGSAAALLIGSSTYAPFTDDANGSGNVAAGSVRVSINGTDAAVFSFDTAECNNMAPGIDCVVPLSVSTGTSTLSATWATTVTDTDDADLDCFSEVTSVPSGTDEADDADDDIDPGYTDDGNLVVRVADNNDCQSATSTITVSIVATQSPSPHN
jgi:predicted ribosomally synthesized peptide with SipW-like signal peptide